MTDRNVAGEEVQAEPKYATPDSAEIRITHFERSHVGPVWPGRHYPILLADPSATGPLLSTFDELDELLDERLREVEGVHGL